MARFNEARKIVEAMKKSEKAIIEMVDTMGNYAVNHFKQSFRDEGFTDESFDPWKRRKVKDSRRGRQFRYEKFAGTDEEEGKRFKVKTVDVRSVKNRAILTKTGRLRRSLVAKKSGRYAVRINSNLPYANVHNEGLRSGRGKGFVMKKRQFVGYSGRLNRKIITKLDSKIQAIFR